MSHVNRRWRYVATQLPSLWRDIDTSLQSADQIMVYLNRSHPLSITVTVDVDDMDPFECQTFIPCLNMIRAHISRLHSLHIHSTSCETLFYILSYFHNLQVPQLECFSLDLFDQDADRKDFSMPIFIQDSPALRTVTLIGITLLKCRVPPTAIVELNLDFSTTTLGKLMTHTVLASMPNLKILSHCGYIFEFSKTDTVILPRLERLDFASDEASSFFTRIYMPSLRYLCLEEIDDLSTLPDAIAECSHTPI